MPDSPSSWLRSLAAEATPGPWRTNTDWDSYGGAERGEANWIQPHGAYSDHPPDNELMALAPDLAVLLADAIDALEHVEELRLWEPGKAGYAAVQNRALELSGALLARFAALQPDNQEEGA